MKKQHSLTIIILLALCACETLNDPNSALSKLGTQVLSVGISQVTGRNVSAADLDGAAALIRSLAGKKTPPAPVEIKAAVVTGTASPSAASTLGSKLAQFISDAVFSGVPHDKALEVAAKKLNEAAVVTK